MPAKPPGWARSPSTTCDAPVRSMLRRERRVVQRARGLWNLPFVPIQMLSRVSSAAAVAILLLSACSSNPPIISGDTSCERFRHISANDAQIKVFADNWEVMEGYADSIVAHNLEYDRHCLGVAP